MDTQLITAEELYVLAKRVWSGSIRNYHQDIVKEDAIQDAVLRAWLVRDKFDPAKSKAVTFFSTVIRNEIHQHAKLRRNNYKALGTGGDIFGERSMFVAPGVIQSDNDDASDDTTRHKNYAPDREPLEQIIEDEDREELQRCIDRLPRRQAEVIEARLNDMPDVLLAQQLGISRQAVGARYSHALDNLRDMMGTA